MSDSEDDITSSREVAPIESISNPLADVLGRTGSGLPTPS
jgi:hypothetical protein